MLQVAFKNIDGKEKSTLELDEQLLGGEVRKKLLYNAVIMYEANKRVGTASTKTRAEVAGTTKKLFRQKGTGNARAGSVRSPIRRKGGVVFGPKPRDYSYSIPKKARKRATQSAILAKFTDNEVVVVEDIQLDAPKTKAIVQIIANLGIKGSVLLVTAAYDENIVKSVRNLPKTAVAVFKDLNAYDVLKYKNMILTKSAFDILTGMKDEEGKS